MTILIFPYRYFKESIKKNAAKPLCPFGKDCFYQHLNSDGSAYIFKEGKDTSLGVLNLLRLMSPLADFPFDLVFYSYIETPYAETGVLPSYLVSAGRWTFPFHWLWM